MRRRKAAERRKYIRLKSVFPVEFRLLSLDGKEYLSDLQQGFTADVSKGGILLRINNPKPELESLLMEKKARLELHINIPFGSIPIEAVSSVAWVDTARDNKRKFLMAGLSFEKIRDKDRNRFIGYSASLYRVPKLAAAALLLLLVLAGLERTEEAGLRRENSVLVENLSQVLRAKAGVVEWLEASDAEKERLLAKLNEQDRKIAEIKKERDSLLVREKELRTGTTEDLGVLKGELDKSRNIQIVLESQLSRLAENRRVLQDEIEKLAERERLRLEDLKRIEKTRLRLEKATLDNMYGWLKVHQNRRTGLVASFEGDSSQKDTAFTYDQSLAAQAYLLNGDTDKAKFLLDFFKYKAKRVKGAFANAYGVNNGRVTEPTVHSGPNIWLGIALMQYMHKTGNSEYLDLAQEIAEWAMNFQNEDPDGGIRGGPDAAWFGTEHNLDAYAFFNMLAEKTADRRYREAAEKSLAWIKKNAYTGKSGRIKRGRGDSTIATDTFAWAVAAIGPERLLRSGMDPDAIMKFAEENCRVTVDFIRPSKETLEVTGFDFARSRHIGRGGVVSSEWTAQMIVSFGVMADFYLNAGGLKKAEYYEKKRNFYLNELEKLIISSPSPSGQGAGCLPYATQDNVDTGHGWRTPRGRDTGSVSGTAYGIFAMKRYNPLRL